MGIHIDCIGDTYLLREVALRGCQSEVRTILGHNLTRMCNASVLTYHLALQFEWTSLNGEQLSLTITEQDYLQCQQEFNSKAHQCKTSPPPPLV